MSVFTQRVRSRSTEGFTLIELMIIVVIIGILSVIAIPTYQGYLNRAKTTEAVGFLADIKARQEAYRSEYLQYCAVSESSTAWWPTAVVSGRFHWDPATVPVGWTHLGASPPGLYGSFQYTSVAGAPGTGTKPGSAGFTDDRGYDGSDFWFISTARADLNDDGTFMTIESYSARQEPWISSARGWD